MTKKVYALQDRKLNVYLNVAVVSEEQVGSFFTELANAVDSPVYDYVVDYDCWCLGEFDEETGRITYEPVRFNSLSFYLDEKRRLYQHMIKTLNYLPNGYFKMPIEKQKEIENDIQENIKLYAKYIVDNSNIDTSKTEEIKNEQ